MKLDVFHVDQLCARVISEGMAVASAVPAVARNFVGVSNPTGRENNRLRPKDPETSALAVVTERSANPISIFQEGKHTNFHVHINALVNAMILKGANHLEPGSITDMRESRIFVATEISLQDTAICRAVEDSAPGFELADPGGS